MKTARIVSLSQVEIKDGENTVCISGMEAHNVFRASRVNGFRGLHLDAANRPWMVFNTGPCISLFMPRESADFGLADEDVIPLI